MKKIKYFIGIGLSVTLLSLSCTKNFSELNTDPNTSEKVLAENLLARALVKTVENNMNRSRTITNELMQVTVNTLVETDRIFRYDIRRNIPEAPWNSWYAQLTNFKDIYKFAKENNADENNSKAYMAISLICQAWVSSIITDTFGDVPYSEANMGKEGIYAPKFDLQKDIYADIFAKLEEANTLLKTTTKNVNSISDPVYKGNVALWRKFGNSLYLRLLMRVSGKAEVASNAVAKIKEMVDQNPANYPLINSNDESAILKWTGVPPYNSPFANMQNSDWRYPKACSFFADKLDFSNDPCTSKWLTTYNGSYEGIPSGYTYGETPETRSYLQYLTTEPLLGNMLNYAEVQLLLAEAAIKGWVTAKTPKEYYEAGATARITLWGRSVGSYLSGTLIAWNDADAIQDKMEKIHWQKYLALFYTDMQVWIEYRRTGHPVLPKGPGLRNNGMMPNRLYYPVSLQATNVTNYNKALTIQGPDDLDSMSWWQKP
ncbi:SusD/RagB family nutrient-binding outer membrane lipoprotein [Pedobacter sp.]